MDDLSRGKLILEFLTSDYIGPLHIVAAREEITALRVQVKQLEMQLLKQESAQRPRAKRGEAAKEK